MQNPYVPDLQITLSGINKPSFSLQASLFHIKKTALQVELQDGHVNISSMTLQLTDPKSLFSFLGCDIILT